MNSFNWNAFDSYDRIVFFTPGFGPLGLKPSIEFGHKMRPFRDLECLRCRKCAGRKAKEGSHGRSGSGEFDEIPSRKAFLHPNVAVNLSLYSREIAPGKHTCRGHSSHCCAAQLPVTNSLMPLAQRMPLPAPSLPAPELS